MKMYKSELLDKALGIEPEHKEPSYTRLVTPDCCGWCGKPLDGKGCDCKFAENDRERLKALKERKDAITAIRAALAAMGDDEFLEAGDFLESVLEKYDREWLFHFRHRDCDEDIIAAYELSTNCRTCNEVQDVMIDGANLWVCAKTDGKHLSKEVVTKKLGSPDWCPMKVSK
jgi:hypothetical protein